VTPHGLPRRADGVVVIRPERLDEVATHLAGEDDDIRRWFHFPRPSARGDVEAYIERSLASFLAGGPRRSFAIADASTDQLCGTVEANHLGEGLANLSYSLHRRARGRGYASRAVRLCMADAVQALPVERFVIRVDPRNTPSVRLVERLDFRFRGGHIEDGRLHWEFDYDVLGGEALGSENTVDEDRRAESEAGGAAAKHRSVEPPIEMSLTPGGPPPWFEVCGRLLERAAAMAKALDGRWHGVAARIPDEVDACRQRMASATTDAQRRHQLVVAWENVQRLVVLRDPVHRVDPETLRAFLHEVAPERR